MWQQWQPPQQPPLQQQWQQQQPQPLQQPHGHATPMPIMMHPHQQPITQQPIPQQPPHSADTVPPLPRLSFLTPQQQQHYEQLFMLHRTSTAFPPFFLGVDKLREILMQSQLPSAVLATVWNLSSVCKRTGGFTFAEFALAMYLAQRALAMPAEPLPPVLPENIRAEVMGADPSSVVSPTMNGGTAVVGAATPSPLPSSRRPSSFAAAIAAIPWAIGAEEKAGYDAVFRQHDEGSGLIGGEKARQLFLQSGVPPSELWQIWNLADLHSIGKLNADEFAVAMHLIYRRLSGGVLPPTLPPELVPPSARNLTSSVEEMRESLVRDGSKRRESHMPKLRESTSTSSMASVTPAGDSLRLNEVYVSANRRRSSATPTSVAPVNRLEAGASSTGNLTLAHTLSRASLDSLTSNDSIGVYVSSKRHGSSSSVATFPSSSSAAVLATRAAPEPQRDVATLEGENNSAKFDQLRTRVEALHAEVVKLPKRSATYHAEQHQRLTSESAALDADTAGMRSAIDAWLKLHAVSTVNKLTLASLKHLNGMGSVDRAAVKSAQERMERLIDAWSKEALPLSVSPRDAASSKSRSSVESPSLSLASFAASSPGSIIIANPPTTSIAASPTTPVDREAAVQAKAAKMLADRMAKLGLNAATLNVGVTSPISKASSAAPPPVDIAEICTAVVAKLDADSQRALDERAQWLKQMHDLEEAVREAQKNVAPVIAAGVRGSGVERVEKWETGVGLDGRVGDIVRGLVAAVEGKKAVAADVQKVATPAKQAAAADVQKEKYPAKRAAAADQNEKTTAKQAAVADVHKEASPAKQAAVSSNEPASDAITKQQALVSPPPTFVAEVTLERATLVAPTLATLQSVVLSKPSIAQRGEEPLTKDNVVPAPVISTQPVAPIPVARQSSLRPDFPPTVAGPAVDMIQRTLFDRQETPSSTEGSPMPHAKSTIAISLLPKREQPMPVAATSFQEQSQEAHTVPTATVAGFESISATTQPTLVRESSNEWLVELSSVQTSPQHAAPINATDGGVIDPFEVDVNVVSASVHAVQSTTSAAHPKSPVTAMSSSPDGTINPFEISTPITSTAEPLAAPRKSIKELASVFNQSSSAVVPLTFNGPIAAPQLPQQPQTVSPVDIFAEAEVIVDDVFSDAKAVDDTTILPKFDTQLPTRKARYPFVILRAQYDYSPQTADELALVHAAFVVAVDMLDVNCSMVTFASQKFDIDADQWWFGRQENGAVGWFPRTYVQEVADCRKSSVSLPSGLELAKAVRVYIAADVDELPLDVGTEVIVLDKSNKEWWRCMNITPGSPGFGNVGLVLSSTFDAQSPVAPLENPFLSSNVLSIGPFGDGFADDAVVASSTAPPGLDFFKSFETKTNTGLFHQVNTVASPVANTNHSPVVATISRPRASTIAAVSITDADRWSAVVAPDVLAGMSEEQRKRQEAIFELIRTEGTYIRNLQNVVEVFYAPLQSSRILSVNDMVGIFANIEDILMTNTKIHSDFEDLQRKSDFVVECIGDVLMRHLSIIEQIDDHRSSIAGMEESVLAYLRYCSNQMASSRLLQQKRGELRKFSEFLKKCMMDPRCRSLDLSSFLLEPMQRITRYPLLIKQVLHYTPKSHPDQKDLLAALAHAEQLLTMVNTAAKVADSEWKMSEISGMVDTENIADGVNLDLRSNTRRFGARECLHEGMLFKAKSGRKLYVYLFNDLLLMCEQTGDAASSTTSDSGQGKMYRVYRKPLPLNEILVGDVAPGTGGTRLMLSGEELVFQVMHGQDMVYLKAPDKKSKKTWMQKIEQAVDVCMKAEKDTQRIRGPLNLKDCVGTLNVLVLDCQDMALDQSVSRADIFCAVHLDRQRQKTRTATLHVHPREPHRVRWNEPLMFSMRSFDQELSFYVYCYDKYSQDDLIGKATISLDFLEYYGNRETERITLELRSNSGKLHVQMYFRAL